MNTLKLQWYTIQRSVENTAWSVTMNGITKDILLKSL